MISDHSMLSRLSRFKKGLTEEQAMNRLLAKLNELFSPHVVEAQGGRWYL